MNTWTLSHSAVGMTADNPLLARLLLVSLELAILAAAVALLIRLLRLRAPRVQALLWLIVLAKPILGLAIGAPLPLVHLRAPAGEPPLSAARGLSDGSDGSDRLDGSDKSDRSDKSEKSDSSPAAPRSEGTPSPTAGRIEPIGQTSARGPQAPPSRSSPASGSLRPPPVGRLLHGLWLAGVAVLSALTLRDQLRIRRLRRATSQVPDALVRRLGELAAVMQLARVPRLRISDALQSPALVGTFRADVLLPRWLADETDSGQLDWLLRHELMHWKLNDPVALAVRRLAEILFFFHPAVWWAGRRWEEAMELACDRALLRTDADARTYAEQLYRVLANQPARCRLPVGGGLFAMRTQIGKRIAALLADPLRSPAHLSALAVAGLALVALISLPVGFGLGRAEPVRPAEPAKSEAPAPSPASVTVALDGSGQYKSIRAAIAAAAPGATIRIAPGTYLEDLTIDKPLTLEGAGWDKTAVVVPNVLASVTDELFRSIAGRMQQAKSDQERQAIQAQFQSELKRMYGLPAVLVSGAKGVAIRNLKLSSPGKNLEGRAMPMPIVQFSQAEARVSGCAVIGCPGDGIQVTERSDVEIRDSLVAGVWSTGIAVGGAAKARIVNCDVRNCYHRCITIGSSAGPTVVEGCRISGSAWHGIRYDNVSPEVVGNLIFGNARSGIYASGKTAATVKRNLFYANEMGGMSCWFQNQDLIEENTFANNQREGLAVLGASKPTVRKDIFYGNPTGVVCSNIGGNSPLAKSDGQVALEQNLFWRNQHDAVRPSTSTVTGEATTATIALDEKAGNLVADPLFVNAADKDFALKPDSPARKAAIGAADPLTLQSPWPLQPEEKAIIPEGETRDFSQWGGKQGTAAPKPTPVRPTPTPAPVITPKPAAYNPAEGGYAWQRTDAFVAPDYEAYFPNDPEGAKQLEALWAAPDKERRPDSEILSTVRRGFRALPQDTSKGEITRWVGNRYLFRHPKPAQPNPDAVELFYHLSAKDGFQSHLDAAYWGLARVEVKSPAILRRLAELGMEGMALPDVMMPHLIAAESGSQKEGLIAYLKPYLESDQEPVRKSAEAFVKIIRGELRASEWVGQIYSSKRYAEFVRENPAYKDLSFGDANARYDRLLAELKKDAADYRAASPVHAQFAALWRDYVIPWRLRGIVAGFVLAAQSDEGSETSRPPRAEPKSAGQGLAGVSAVAELVVPLFKDIVADMRKLPDYETRLAALDPQARSGLDHLLVVAGRQGEGPKPDRQYANPYEIGSREALLFEQAVNNWIAMLADPVKALLLKTPAALEAKQKQAQQLYEFLQIHPARGQAVLPAAYVDEYADSLEKENQKIADFAAAEYVRRAAELKIEAAALRVKFPVYQEFLDVVRNYVIPWGRRELVPSLAPASGPEGTAEERKAVEEAAAKLVAPVFKNILTQLKQMKGYDLLVAETSSRREPELKAALDLIEKYGDGKKPEVNYVNPYTKRTWQSAYFERIVAEDAIQTMRSLSGLLHYLPLELAAKERRLDYWVQFIPEDRTKPNFGRPPKYEGPFAEALGNELKKAEAEFEKAARSESSNAPGD